MVVHYNVSWNSYRNNVCKGFMQLQQEEVFVDMTLAADGHLVKVHRSMIALASPYLKHLLQSAPCQHPVIFLNNISHTVLAFLLDYIYFGEVQIPKRDIVEFIAAAKSLHINGIENFVVPEDQPEPPQLISRNIPQNRNVINKESGVAALIAIHPDGAISSLEENSLKAAESKRNVDIRESNVDRGVNAAKKETQLTIEINNGTIVQSNNSIPIEDFDAMDTSENVLLNNEVEVELPLNTKNNEGDTFKIDIPLEYGAITVNPPPNMPSTNTDHINTDSLGVILHYTMSSRGNIQLIVNRFMYYCHHLSGAGSQRRWRCIDYRKKRCPAFIDTNGELVVKRKGKHCHGLHDDKIFKKGQKAQMFATLAQVQEFSKTFHSRQLGILGELDSDGDNTNV